MTNKIDKIQMPDGQVLKLNGGSGLEVGDIGMALYVDETKGLRRYLNGQIVDINANTQAFLNRLLEIKNTNPDYFTTEANWQSEALLNIDGCVYKFVLNYSGETVVSVRLPKYPDYVEINAGGTLPVVGNGMTLGWTDGTVNLGSATGSNGNYHFQFMQGSYGVSVGSAPGTGAPSGAKIVGITSDPTKSGIQTTLKQTKLKLRYFIQIATGSETENNIINDIELNNPYSLFDSKYSDHELNNLSWLKSEGQWNAKSVYPTAYDKLLKVYNGTETVEGLSVKLSTEDYTDYDFVLNTADETFRLPIEVKINLASDINWKNKVSKSLNATYTADTNGYIVYTGNSSGSTSGTAYAYVNGQEIAKDIHSSDVDDAHFYIPVSKGDTYKITDNLGSLHYYFVPLSKSNLYLYFYVGETVQNANLIDAGRIGEQLANKTDMLQASGAGMPSNRYIDLTLGASGSEYIAPANGWVYFGKFTTENNQYISLRKLKQNALEYSINNFCTSANNGLNIIMPITEGQKFAADYTAGGEVYFRFIYAEGAQ